MSFVTLVGIPLLLQLRFFTVPFATEPCRSFQDPFRSFSSMNRNHSDGVRPPPPSKKSSDIIFLIASLSFLYMATVNCRQKPTHLRLASTFTEEDVCATPEQQTTKRSIVEISPQLALKPTAFS